MKKIIFVIVMMACMSQIHAQVHFGIKGGVNFDDPILRDVKNSFTLDKSTGWQAGILLQAKIPTVGLGIQPELLYTTVKANVDNETNSINYFELPLNVYWGFNLIIIRPYLTGGPYFCYALQSDGRAFKDRINKFDWGMSLGGGIEIWKFQFGARYSWGLQNVSSTADFELKNNRFTLSLAFLF